MAIRPKIRRYWTGKAPDWATDANEDGDMEDSDHIAVRDDPRLRRLAARIVDNLEEARAARRLVREAEIVRAIDQEEEDDDDDEDDLFEERRRRIKEKLLRREQEELVDLLPEEDESEFETDMEEKLELVAMVKPVFVLKSERDTIAERERLDAQELALEESEKRRLEERKIETKQIVVEKIQKNMEVEANIAVDHVDTDVEVNEATDYEAWKVREFGRIKRDREDREAILKVRLEVERVRDMTEEERREWERKNPKSTPKPKRKWSFLQRYYHKGAFFQDSDNIVYNRDCSSPTGEDKMGKTMLPKLMQFKRFGHRGRTKWTHLVNEDTTDRLNIQCVF